MLKNRQHVDDGRNRGLPPTPTVPMSGDSITADDGAGGPAARRAPKMAGRHPSPRWPPPTMAMLLMRRLPGEPGSADGKTRTKIFWVSDIAQKPRTEWAVSDWRFAQGGAKCGRIASLYSIGVARSTPRHPLYRLQNPPEALQLAFDAEVQAASGIGRK